MSSVSCPTGGGGLLAELSRRQGQSQMETDGWEGDATAVVRPPAREPLCAARAAQALTEAAGGNLATRGCNFARLVASSRLRLLYQSVLHAMGTMRFEVKENVLLCRA